MVIAEEPAKRCIKIPQRPTAWQDSHSVQNRILDEQSRIDADTAVALVLCFTYRQGNSVSSSVGTGGQATSIP